MIETFYLTGTESTCIDSDTAALCNALDLPPEELEELLALDFLQPIEPLRLTVELQARVKTVPTLKALPVRHETAYERRIRGNPLEAMYAKRAA